MRRLLAVLLTMAALTVTTGCDEFEIEDVQLSFGSGLSWLLPGYSEVYYYPGESCCEYVVETYEREEFWVEEVWMNEDGYWWP